MGKLGVASLGVVAGVCSLLLASHEATAQDFGQAWVDHVTHELEQERGPLQAKPFTWNAEGGVEYSYDNNVFLTQTQKKSDSIIIPFVQADLAYGEPRFDLEGSLLADYKGYFKQHASGDEERAYFRARQTSVRWNFEIAEIFQNVIDPSGVLFLNRVRHDVSNTIPKIAFDLGRSFGLEAGGNVQIVRFRDGAYSGQENNEFSVDLTGVYRTPWSFDLLAQIGYYNIRYILPQDQGGTPGDFGYYYRVGFRGDVVERFHLEALVGYTDTKTDFFAATGTAINKGTLSASLNSRYEVTENFNFFLDFARLYAFEGFGDPYQLLNTATFYGRYDLSDKSDISARIQYDDSASALHVHRWYYSGSLGMDYKFTAHIIANAGVTYRSGQETATGQPGTIKFNDFILSAGVAFSW